MKHTKFCIILCLVMGATLLSSCGLYGKYEARNPEADSIVTPAYTDIFTDPMLQGLIEKALLQNLDLKMAHERVCQASAQYLGSRLAYVPSVGVNAQVGLGPKDATNPNGYTYQVGGQVDWNLDIFGRLYNRMHIAKADQLSALDMEQLYRAELIASVANRYYQLLMLDAQIEIIDSIGNTFRESVETLRAMKDAGMTDEAAVAQYEGNYHNVLAEARTLRLTRHEVENALRILLSDPGYGEIRRMSLNTTSADYHLDSIPLMALLTRPDVRQAEHQLERAFYGVQLSRANCCPNLSLSGLVGFNGGFIWSAVGSLLQPLFNSGRNIAEVRVSKSVWREAEYNYQSALVKAAVDVNDAMAARHSYLEQVEDNVHEVAAFERALDAAQTKFRLGQGTYLESLLALQQLRESRIRLADTYSRVLQAQVELYLALGGGR